MDDNELIGRMRSGDGEAFRAFYAAYAGPLYRLLLEKSGDPGLARQTLKDVFSQAHARIRAGEDVAALYLETLALLRLGESAAKAAPAQEAAAPKPGSEQPMNAQPASKAGKSINVRDGAPSMGAPPTPAREATARDASLKNRRRDARKKWPPVPVKRRRAGGAPMAMLAVVLILLILWVLAGYLMSVGILPHSNLGYEWFNTHVYPLF